MEIEKIVQETFSNYHRGAVMILMRGRLMDKAYLSTGSGFIIGKGETFYLVMTCKHCVVSTADNITLSVRVPGKTTEYEAEKLYDSDVADIAIIKVKCMPKSEECPVLKFGDSENITLNTGIVQLGYVFSSGAQLNLNPSVAPGTIV